MEETASHRGARRTSADLAIVGARIRTLDPARPFASAVAIRDGVIVAVGDDAEVRVVCDAATELVDGAGLAVVPGLTDAHMHPVWGAELTEGVDLGGLTAPEAVRAALARAASALPADAWVQAWNLDYAVFGTGPIDGDRFDDALGGRPLIAIFYDLHTGLANPRALREAGVDGPRKFADASEVVVRDGRLTGELREMSAYRAVLDRMPGAGPAERRRKVAAALRRLAALGLTGAHMMDGTPASFELFDAIEADGGLPLRLVVPLWQQPDASDEQVAAQLALRDVAGRRWRGGVAKFFIDGVIDSGTAWLHEPDSDGGSQLPFWPDPARYAEVVARFARAGFQCVTHACGDRAVVAALDAYAAAGAQPANGARHRVEHLETLTDADVRAVAAAGVVASMQPLHMQWRAADGSDSWTRRLGPVRAAHAFRTRDLLDAGVPLALGSDWPVAQADPRIGMAWARLRRTPGAPDAPVFEPDQALSAIEALEGYTSWNAAAVGEQERLGRIAPGFAGDLTAFVEDPVAVDADELPRLPVALTVVDGQVVHQADVGGKTFA